MGALIRLAPAILLVAPAPAPADTVARWRAHVEEASLRFGIPAEWIYRVMRAESGGQIELDGRPIRSPKGAMGLMQLMPATWAEIRARLGLGDNPDDPRDNILAGTAYLRLMYDQFGYPGLFGAYNAGPARYAAWLAGRDRLPSETIAYLGTVAGPGRVRLTAPEASPRQRLFALRRDLETSVDGPADRAAENGLFAVRRGVP